MISKTYVYQTKKDASGNTYHEKYFSHNYAMKGSDGTTVRKLRFPISKMPHIDCRKTRRIS